MASLEQLTPRSGRVKAAKRLATRRFRAETREFLAEGPQSVREALTIPGAVLEVFATESATDRYADLATAGAPWHVVDETVVAAVADTVSPQGMVARCRFVDVSLAEALRRAPRLVVVCADVRDPGNAGAVVRCADAAGADAVVLAGSSVDPFNPKAVRASVGSVFHLDLVIEPDTAAVVAAVREAGLAVLAADGGGDHDLFTAADDGTLARPTAWLLGNEAWGIRDDVRALADAVVAVPLFGRAESLNLATAAAVCLYASAAAQRR